MNKLSFDEIKQTHESAKASKMSVGNLPLGEFANLMQQGDDQNDWSEGQKPDNWIGATSRGIDKAFEATALPWGFGKIGEAAGAGVDSLAGETTPRFAPIGKDIGEGLPRMVADVGLTMGGASIGFTPLGVGMMAVGTADTMAKAYDESGGSGKSALLAGGLNLAAPGISKVGAGLGSRLVPKALKFSPTANVLAEEVGQQGAFFAAQSGVDAIEGRNPFTAENAFANALGTVAFAPLSVQQGAKTFKLIKGNNNLRKVAGSLDKYLNESTQKAEIDNQQLVSFLLDEPGAKIPSSLQDKSKLDLLTASGVLNADRLSEVNQNAVLENQLKLREGVGALGSPDIIPGRTAEFKNKPKAMFNKELGGFPEGSTVSELPGGKWQVKAPDDMTAKLKWDADVQKLASEVAPMLDQPTETVVDLIKLAQKSNQVKKVQDADPALESVPRGKPVAATEYVEVGGKLRPKAVMPADPQDQFPFSSGSPTTDQVSDTPGYQTPEGIRPKAVKGKVSDLAQQLSEPAREASAPIRVIKARIGEEFTKLTGESPDVALTKLAGIDLRNIRRKAGNLSGDLEADPYTPEQMTLLKKWQKTTAKDSFLEFPSDKPENSVHLGENKDGFVTRQSLEESINRQADIEPDPANAVVRVAQALRNKLASWYHGTNTQEGAIVQGMKLAQDTYDRLGLAPEMRDQYMQATERVLKQVATSQTNYKSLELAWREGLIGGLFYEDTAGAYFRELDLATVRMTFDEKTPASAFQFLSTLTHESVHGLLTLGMQKRYTGADTYRNQVVDRVLRYGSELDQVQKERMMWDMYEHFLPKEVLAVPGTRQELQAKINHFTNDPEEFVTQYASFMAMANTGVKAKQGFMARVAAPLRDFMQAVFRGMSELKQMVFGQAKANGMDVGQLELFQKDIESLLKPNPEVIAAEEFLAKAVQATAALEKGDFAGQSVVFEKTGVKAADEYGAEAKKPRFGNTFTRNVFQHAQTAFSTFYKETLPEYGRVVHHLANMDGLAVYLQHAMRKDFMFKMDGGLFKSLVSIPDAHLTPQKLKEKSVFIRVRDSQPLQRKIFDTMLKSNELTKVAADTAGAYPTWEHPEIQKIVADLTPTEKADAQHTFETYKTSNAYAAKLQVDVAKAQIEFAAADYYLGSGMDAKQARETGKLVTEAATTGRLAELPLELQQHPGTEAFLKHWERTEDKFVAYTNYLARPHFTEFRSGRWGVRYETQVMGPDGQMTTDTGYRSTNDKYQYKAILEEIGRDPRNRLLGTVDQKSDPKSTFGQMQTRGLEEAINLTRAHYEAAMANMNPKLVEMFQGEIEASGFDPAQPLVAAVNAQKLTMAPRRLAPGRESINMIAAQDAYSSLISRKLANTLTRMETNWELKSRNWDADPHLRNEIQVFRDKILNAGAQEFQGFRKLTTLITMGGNISSALVDSTQNITMGLWRATAGVGFWDALKYTSQGYKEAFVPLEKMKDTQFKEILVEATNKGFLKTGGTMDQFFSSDDVMNYNVIKAQNNRDLVDMKTYLTSKEFAAHRVFETMSGLGDRVMHASMTPMRLSAQINNKTSLWVGYKMGVQKGLKGRELFDHAIDYMQTVNLQGQRAAQSSFKLKAGAFNETLSAATLMTNYPIAVFAQMHSNWISAVGKSGLSPAARKRSAQALAGQILTQAAFAGLSGLGMKSLFAVAKEVFDVDPELAIREGTAALDESGTLGEVILNGVMNQVTGVDLASRFDLSGVGGFNPYTGFDAKGLFGAGGGTVTALYNAPGQIAKGDISKMQFIPTGYRRMLTAFGDDAFKDSTGQTIIDPSAAERVGQFLGFKPARFSRAMEQKRMMRTVEQQASQESTKEKAAMLQSLQAGDIPSVLKKIEERVTRDLSGPEGASLSAGQFEQTKRKRIQSEMLELASYGVEKLLPIDQLETGSGEVGIAKQQAGKALGNKLTPRATEVQRVTMKNQILQTLGADPSIGRTRAVIKAKKVDALLAQNPTLTRSQALAILQDQ